MAWYKAGSITTTTNSPIITGTGTAFVNHARYGDALQGPDGRWYEIINVLSDTSISVAPNYVGNSVSGAEYSIVPVQGYVKASADTLNEVTQDLVGRLDAIDNLDAAELNYLNGVTSNIQTQLDSKFTGNPSYISARANHTGTQAISTVVGLDTALANKQQLTAVLTATTASFTSVLESKLSAIAPAATANQTDTYLLTRTNHIGTQDINTINSLQVALNNKQPIDAVLSATTDSFTIALHTKLDGIAPAATVNSSDAALRDRVSHTGTQSMSTITGLAAEFATKQATLLSGVNIATINGQSILTGSDIAIAGDVVLNGIQTLNGKSGATVNLVPSDIGAATTAQGVLANSAIQSAAMTTAINNALTGYTTDAQLASGLATRATTAQGALAQSALQVGAIENNTFVKRIRTLALAAI